MSRHRARPAAAAAVSRLAAAEPAGSGPGPRAGSRTGSSSSHSATRPQRRQHREQQADRRARRQPDQDVGAEDRDRDHAERCPTTERRDAPAARAPSHASDSTTSRPRTMRPASRAMPTSGERQQRRDDESDDRPRARDARTRTSTRRRAPGEIRRDEADRVVVQVDGGASKRPARAPARAGRRPSALDAGRRDARHEVALEEEVQDEDRERSP